MSHPRWEKLGRVFDPQAKPRHPKLSTHAANPLAVHREGDVYRVFYSARDAQKRSSVGAVDIDIVTREIVQEHFEPVFEHGPEGSFYADGVSIGNCYTAPNGGRYILFMAWQIPKNAHWRGEIGRLRLTSDLKLVLDPETPFMRLDETDSISLSYPWVHQTSPEHYQMWYGSTHNWDAGNGEMLHVLNYATSNDGHVWSKQGLGVPYEIGTAQAFSRPTVAPHPEGGLEMWFSYRGKLGRTYRIGYAYARDGKTWSLLHDVAGINVSGDGWDSDMIEYPFVFDHAGARYMLYNGNGHGHSGFGLAVMHRD